jgi:hypothetical protein
MSLPRLSFTSPKVTSTHSLLIPASDNLPHDVVSWSDALYVSARTVEHTYQYADSERYEI